MPAKIDTELNLRFLYICFKHSNFSTVDFHEVASYFQIKAPAARMRLMRLRQALEAESSREGFRERDRKRRLNPFKVKDKPYAFHDGEDDDDETLDDMPLRQRRHARTIRIKQEEGLMIKGEDGTLIKGEDDAMIKNEDDGFWGKKEEDLDDKDDKRMVKREERGAPFFKYEVNPVDMEDATRSGPFGLTYAPCSVRQNVRVPYTSLGQGEVVPKSEHIPSRAVHQPAPYPGPVKMELDTKRNNYGYGINQHSQPALANPSHFNFRVYDQPNNSTPFAHTQSNAIKPENTNNPAPFLGYSTMPRPDTYTPCSSIKPGSSHGNAHATPASELNSPFRLDMFNTALPNSETPSAEVRSRLSYADSVNGSPRIKDDASETASEQGCPSPAVSQTRQDNLR